MERVEDRAGRLGMLALRAGREDQNEYADLLALFSDGAQGCLDFGLQVLEIFAEDRDVGEIRDLAGGGDDGLVELFEFECEFGGR